MTIVSGKNTANRPYFFRDVNGQRVEIPSFGVGQGDLEGSELAEFKMYETAGQIRSAEVKTKPINVSIPEISGNATVGVTLTASYGVWKGDPEPSKTIQWQRGTSNISGATSNSYKTVEADAGKSLRVVVKASNEMGSDSAYSQDTQLVTLAPSNTAAPIISGTATQGQKLTTSSGSWSGFPAPSYTYQWMRDGANISNATSGTYDLIAADVGKKISCVVTATNSAGSKSQSTEDIGPIAPLTVIPSNTVAPAVTGDTDVGSTLTSTNGTWTGTPAPTFTRSWQLSIDGTSGWADISGETAATYVIDENDEQKFIRSVVTATNTAGNKSANSNVVGPITIPAGGTT